ncbi:RHS repeat domain-containing protein [Pseudomonas kurunegalensis]|uniref:RHS repeat domain-containing protein n=1 Tax=Pseudomonas kurunegalensis TaxID=485880 RepID=UPI0025707E42|nr:RHS repeat-associated core domain-containing protein [Pseudomonas kurunegalensis]WJD64143.1 RHS repeat-associated core domain-containing protein [Pseudomonas kurunegalensis]
MSTTSTAQSNAYNFSTFVQNSVDPRTGQYTLAIVLPELVGNDQMGPALPLRLGFNPMNHLDAGFGHGWSLNLSQYVPASNLLSLQTGETLKVTGSDMGDGTGLALDERKLESFHLHQEDTENWRVEYKHGLVEFLQLKGPSSRRVALPVRIEAASGHSITLNYDDDFNQIPCLTSIVDANNETLLKITYDSGSVVFDLYPDVDSKTLASARYEVKLDKRGTPALRLPRQVLLPAEEGAGWDFDYEYIAYDENLGQNLALLKEITTPFGAVETVEYWVGNNGHRFPNDARPPLPRVKRHAVDPRFDQPVMVTTYDYTDNNYLGRGASGIAWRDDGLDNLYQFSGSDFEYGSTASHWLKAADDTSPGDGKVLRTVTTRYNRFHLMTHETEAQNGCVQETYTEYHEQEGLQFARQPAYFQLPHKVTQRWRFEDGATWPREETKTTFFDEHCNLLEEIEHDGIRTVYEYYPIEGEKEIIEGKEEVACPADPQHFKRRIKYKTTYPSTQADSQAAILRSHYRYKEVAPLNGARKAFGEALVKDQRTLQLASADENAATTLLQHSELTYLEKPDNPLLHMRPDTVRQTMKHGEDPLKDRTTTSTSFYSLINGDDSKQSLLQTRHTTKGHDLIERVQYSAVSRYTGQVMRQQDSNGVYTHVYYDALRRRVRETMAPGTSYEVSRTYDYHLSVNGSQPTHVTTDVQNVVSTLLLDGLNRKVGETRNIDTANDPQNPVRKTFTVANKQYDSLGRQCAETVHDELDDNQRLALTTRFDYDDWGNLSKTVGPDGVIHRQQRTPFGEDGDIIETWQERANEGTPEQPVKRQRQKTELNRFGKPVYEQRIDLDGQEVGRRDYLYDGLGRSVQETRTQRDPLSTPAALKAPLRHTWKFSYDVWGRMERNERPDNSALLRKFADFTSDELTTRLELEGDATPICTRTFDGLGRMSTLTVGPRIERYDYQEGRTLVHQHHRSSKRTHTYSYQPEVTTQPIQISTTLTDEKGQPATSLDNPNFTFERPDASITSATNPEGKRTYRYTDQGYLLQESWKGDTTNSRINDDHAIDYRYSPLGRTLKRSSGDESTVHHYDPQGRLKKTLRGKLEASFEYDDDGRLKKTETVDQHSKRKVICEQQYDCFGREVQRTLTLDDGTEQVLEQTWRDDDQLHTRTRHQNGVLLLEETFAYDDLDRLESVDYIGSQLPCNTAGRAMTSQIMRFDERDQLTRCSTTFEDGETDSARFTYKTDGSCQLERVTHSLQPDYPADQSFSYDADGNMRNDEWGRLLHYDDRSRLIEVRASDDKEVLAKYRYDGHDHVLGATHGNAAEVQRRYQGYRLSATLDSGVLTHYLYDGESALAMQVDGQPDDNRLLLTDAGGSVVGEYAASGLHNTRYSAYGERTLDKEDEEEKHLVSLLAFNGEVREAAFGWYLLGRGYRAYNPGLMRFHSPDSLAPEQSGINPYLYVLGNPVNWRDPTGHYAESNNDPLPPVIDPIEEPKLSLLDKWQNVMYAAIGVVVGLAFVAAFPPAGIGILITVIGGVAAVGGLGMAVYGTVTDDPQIAQIGMMVSAVGSGIMSLAAVGQKAVSAIKKKFFSKPGADTSLRGPQAEPVLPVSRRNSATVEPTVAIPNQEVPGRDRFTRQNTSTNPEANSASTNTSTPEAPPMPEVVLTPPQPNANKPEGSGGGLIKILGEYTFPNHIERADQPDLRSKADKRNNTGRTLKFVS